MNGDCGLAEDCFQRLNLMRNGTNLWAAPFGGATVFEQTCSDARKLAIPDARSLGARRRRCRTPGDEHNRWTTTILVVVDIAKFIHDHAYVT
jgi:hypothetical protein